MDKFNKKEFQAQYSKHLERDIQKHQTPFATIEEEYEKIARKYDSVRSIKPSSSDLSQSNNLEYVEKFQHIINAPSSKEFKDMKVLNKLAEYNEHAQKELKTLKEGLYIPTGTSEQLDKKPSGNNQDRFDTYQKVQRMVDKVIYTTVHDLENDLNLLSDRQKGSRVINRLSNVQLPNSPNSSLLLKLPKLKDRGTIMQVNNTQTPSSRDETGKLSAKYTPEGLSILREEKKQPQRALAGFYVKEKKQKLNTDRDKDVMRKQSVETFLKADMKVKNLSKQYLFNLTQHNNPSQDNLSSRVMIDGDMSDLGNTNLQKTITGNTTFDNNDVLTTRMYNNSYGGGNNTNNTSSYFNNLSSEQQTVMKKIDMTTPDKRKVVIPQTDRQNATWKKMNGKRPGNKSSTTPHWLEQEKQTEAMKNQFMYEGMGLLTLHNGKKLPVNNPSVFSVDYFNLHVEKLNMEDLDYIRKRTGVNLKHSLYDRVLSEKDVLRFERVDLKLL